MDYRVILLLILEGAFALWLLYRAGLMKKPAYAAAAVILVILAFGARFAVLDYQTLDYQDFLSRWVDYFRRSGGFRALREQVGNYNIPYLYFLALFSYSSISDLYLIKLLSIFFDIILAWASMLLLGRYTQSPARRMGLFFTVLFLPTVFLNGSLWAQCDSSYVALAVLGIYLALDDRPVLSMVCVLDELERAESERDISDIRRELIATGYIRKAKGGKPERVKAQAPLKFVSDDGFEILVGRSNAQNDELTTKLARRTDYWLHTQKVHGSHVIIRCDGLEPPERTIEQAAALAAYYSQGREGGKIPVDYTMLRNVRKPSGALPGKVIYTEYKTLLVQADASLAARLKK